MNIVQNCVRLALVYICLIDIVTKVGRIPHRTDIESILNRINYIQLIRLSNDEFLIGFLYEIVV